MDREGDRSGLITDFCFHRESTRWIIISFFLLFPTYNTPIKVERYLTFLYFAFFSIPATFWGLTGNRPGRIIVTIRFLCHPR